MNNKNLPRKYRGSINTAKAIKLYNKGVSLNDIALALNCDKANLHKHLKERGITFVRASTFTDTLSVQLKGLVYNLLNSTTTNDIKGMSVRDRVVSMGIAIDKYRLINDQSTSNVAFRDVTRQLVEDIKRLKVETRVND